MSVALTLLAACSSTPQQKPDAGDAGSEAGLPDAGTSDGGNADADASTPACTDPTSGTAAKFAANAVTLPMQSSDFAIDLDGTANRTIS